MVIRSDPSAQPCIVPDLRENAFCFTIENGVCCGFVIYGLYYVDVLNETGHLHFCTYYLWLLLCYKNTVVVTDHMA